MSQFTFTPAEDLLVLNCVRAKAAQYLSAYGVKDADLEALMEKIESQYAPVVESAPEVVVEATEEPPEVAEAEAAAEAMEAAEETPTAE
jgi:hypothetical protein